MGQFAVGQPVPREEDPRLLTGRSDFLDDVNLRGQAWGYVLRSPHAAADIRSIDTEAAKASHGVLAVLTGADWAAGGSAAAGASASAASSWARLRRSSSSRKTSPLVMFTVSVRGLSSSGVGGGASSCAGGAGASAAGSTSGVGC